MLQIRSYMRAIFAEAVDQDYLPKDPARTVKVPANLREVDKTTLTLGSVAGGADRNLGLRDWILMKLDMSNALRPSELFPLRWRCFPRRPTLDIQETVYKGKIRPYGKTKGSLTKVPIADLLARSLSSAGNNARTPSPEAFIFPGRFGDQWIRATSAIACCTSWPRNWNCRS